MCCNSSRLCSPKRVHRASKFEVLNRRSKSTFLSRGLPHKTLNYLSPERVSPFNCHSCLPMLSSRKYKITFSMFRLSWESEQVLQMMAGDFRKAQSCFTLCCMTNWLLCRQSMWSRYKWRFHTPSMCIFILLLVGFLTLKAVDSWKNVFWSNLLELSLCLEGSAWQTICKHIRFLCFPRCSWWLLQDFT